ncbi:MAG TPA: hypothetical protein VK796_06640 [Cytophaga sp.]|jgi:hypothetical protein|nr:hypothetical protein [Cytophaga sp.]
MKKIILIAIIVTGISCSGKKAQIGVVVPETFLVEGISTDSAYGLTPLKPVEVGGKYESGPYNESRYLDALAGPHGERLKYYRSGSCCPVESKNGMFGMAMLDNYKVSYEGSKDTVSIYINMYDKGVLKAPVGFTVRNKN